MTSRTQTLVTVLLTLAGASVVIAGALALGFIEPQFGGGPAASPSPAASPTSAAVEPSPSAASTPSPSPAPTPAITPSPTEVGEQSYTVQSGDTLAAIADRFGVTMQAIVALNNLENPDRILIGQVLIIPAPGATPGLGDCYVVEPGDTLEEIAYELRLSTDELARANDIENPDDIRAGQCLIIPGRSASPSPAASP
ncbi:hypothetical protein BH23CHL7_BH23CHL7_12610 [soil metagenome]